MKLTKTQRSLVIPAVLIVILLIAVIASQAATKSKPVATPSVSKTGNAVAGQPSGYQGDSAPTPTAAPTTLPSSTPSATPAPLTKPTLQKSSGNAAGSTVAKDSVIVFTCEGTPGLSCAIVLTDRSNPSHIITLPAKPISGNGRDQYAAVWDWTAQTGSWNVQSRVSDGSGSTSSSDTQTLEVSS